MRLRFVHGADICSYAIIALEKTAMPFTPSHVEAVMPNGMYLGSHLSGGVQERKPGYDDKWRSGELFLELEATALQDQVFHAYLRNHIGEPYDWESFAGYLIPAHFHKVNHTICSALIALGLRASDWFRWPLAAPAHLIDPRDLLLILSGMMRIPM